MTYLMKTKSTALAPLDTKAVFQHYHHTVSISFDIIFVAIDSENDAQASRRDNYKG